MAIISLLLSHYDIKVRAYWHSTFFCIFVSLLKIRFKLSSRKTHSCVFFDIGIWGGFFELSLRAFNTMSFQKFCNFVSCIVLEVCFPESNILCCEFFLFFTILLVLFVRIIYASNQLFLHFFKLLLIEHIYVFLLREIIGVQLIIRWKYQNRNL